MRISSRAALAIAAVSISAPVYSQTHTQPRSDMQIIADVRNVLNNEDALKGPGNSISASIRAGVVTLSGSATSNAARVLASRDIADVPGIKTVLNDITVGSGAAAAPNAVDTRPKTAAAATSTPDRTKLLELKPHTQIPIRLQEEIDTKTAKEGDTFHGTVAANVFENGYALIPVDTPVFGRVVEAKPAGRLVGFALLTVELVALRLPTPGGEDQNVSIVTAQVSSRTNGRGAGTAASAGGGAGLGALLGALAGGGKGAAIGAASGGALGTGARALTPGQQIDLKPEALLIFVTQAPVSVPVLIHNGLPALRDAASGQAGLRTRTAASTPTPAAPPQ